MKKILSTTSLLLGFILLTSSTLVAQNDIKIGIGADYGIEVEAIGVEVVAVYWNCNKKVDSGLRLIKRLQVVVLNNIRFEPGFGNPGSNAGVCGYTKYRYT